MPTNRITVRIEIDLTADEIAVLKRFAAEAYRAALGIGWRTVASAWSENLLKDRIAKYADEQAKQVTAGTK